MIGTSIKKLNAAAATVTIATIHSKVTTIFAAADIFGFFLKSTTISSPFA